MRLRPDARFLRFLTVTLALSLSACVADSGDEEDEFSEELELLDTAPNDSVERLSQEGKEDGLGSLGPALGCCSSTQVWDVRNQWDESNTSEARRAGLAWGANSGLTWDEKYRLWVASFEQVPGAGYGNTFEITNPWGRTLPAPRLECAEVAYFLRASFAAWYGLPFYVEASDSGGPIYLGHFGFVRKDGSRWENSPRFARLADHSGGHAHGQMPSDWPSDGRLRGRGLYGGGDENEFLFEGALAGAYLDEMYLNKRVGYFLLTLLSYFGSVHLADTTITFHVQADAVAAGDIMVERWQRRGIGHTVPILRVDELVPGRFQATVASGSMPRRQPVWEGPERARRYFTNVLFGGHGQSSDGEPYAALGGGLRRWRVAVPHQGRWRNTIPAASRNVWINSADIESLAARVDRFEEIMATVTPAEQRDVLLSVIESKRDHLSRYPASCSARTAREESFEALYTLMSDEFGQTRQQVDEEYRTLADYVFAELEYDQSRTCCWNSSTADMYRIVMDYNREQQQDACVEPTVFMMRDGGYSVFKTFAEARGEGHLWRPWSADEPCPQENSVRTDTEQSHDWTAFCSLGAIVDPEPDPGTVADACADGNDTTGTATVIDGGADGRICSGDEDFYTFTVSGTANVAIQLSFSHADGDLELELRDASGDSLRSSTSGSDDERIEKQLPAGTYYVRVWGYSNAANDYTLTIAGLGGGGGGGGSLPDPEPGTGDGNDTIETAEPLDRGASVSGTIDGTSDQDFYLLDVGDYTVTMTYDHSAGDLDVALLDAGSDQIDVSQGTSGTETISVSSSAPTFLRVYGYSGATGSYTLTLQ